jgi:hypothetical protein
MLTRVMLICVGVVLVSQIRAYAYTDPGSGTLIWQMLLAASFGIMFYLRRMITWFRALKAGRDKTISAEKESETVEKIGI